jgi:hypothetical protein
VHAGHTSVDVTLDRYGHLYTDNDDEFLRALDAATDNPVSEQAKTSEERGAAHGSGAAARRRHPGVGGDGAGRGASCSP